MKWKEIFITAIIVIVILFVIQIILGFAMRWYFEKEWRALEEEGWGTGLGIELIEISCIPGSHYNLTLKNNGNKTFLSDNLSFYIDESRVVCEGINDLEPDASVVCRISQFTNIGLHSLDISGPNFSMSRSVTCP